MHLNSVQLIGRVGKNGVKLSYGISGAPSVSFTLEVDEVAKSGDVFVLYLPIEIWGQAELAAETLEPGDEVMLSGKLKYKSVVDAKTQVKTSKLIISTWGIQQRQSSLTETREEDGAVSREGAPEIVQPGHSQVAKPARQRPYPRAALQGGVSS